MNRRGGLLVSHEVVVNLIAAARTQSGLAVRSGLDPAACPKGVAVSDADFAALHIEPDDFHGDWNDRLRSG